MTFHQNKTVKNYYLLENKNVGVANTRDIFHNKIIKYSFLFSYLL